MEKKRRRRKGERGVHTAVVLPREMLDLLRESGRRQERGVSEEIRERLAGSLFEDARDPTTRSIRRRNLRTSPKGPASLRRRMVRGRERQ